MESGPVFGLQVCRWVPAGVEYDYTVCSGDVQPYTSTSAERRTENDHRFEQWGGGGGAESEEGKDKMKGV